MSMQKMVSGGLLVALVWMGQSARGEDGELNQYTLKQMGLGGLVAMSDVEAESVRGLGFQGGGGHGSWASVSGSSYANIDSRYGDAHSENDYSSHGKHEASGRTDSHAGVEITKSYGNHGHNNGGNGNGYGDGNGNGSGNGNGNGHGHSNGNGNGNGYSHGNGNGNGNGHGHGNGSGQGNGNGNGNGYGHGNGGGGNQYCGNSGGGNHHPGNGQGNGNGYGGGHGNGNWNGGGGQGNRNCYGGGGRTTTTTIKVFAGGSSYAKAH